jgi:hypothetical protein
LIKLPLSFDSSSSLAQVALARLEGQRVVQQGAATIAIAGGVGGVGVATAVTKNGRASSSSSITTASRRVTMERLANACRDSLATVVVTIYYVSFIPMMGGKTCTKNKWVARRSWIKFSTRWLGLFNKPFTLREKRFKASLVGKSGRL